MTLRASFARAIFHVIAWLALVTAIAAVADHWRTGNWWDADYLWSLLIPFFLFPVVVLAFLPRQLTLSDDSLVIERPFRENAVIAFDDLEYFMDTGASFMIQVREHGPYQIYDGGFARREWRAFKRELERLLPGRKARWNVGDRLFGGRNT
jgi:hypothetical protein